MSFRAWAPAIAAGAATAVGVAVALTGRRRGAGLGDAWTIKMFGPDGKLVGQESVALSKRDVVDVAKIKLAPGRSRVEIWKGHMSFSVTPTKWRTFKLPGRGLGDAFTEAKEKSTAINAEVASTSAVLKRFPKNAVGLTPDAVRLSLEYREAKANYDRAFARLRAFNEVYVKSFAKELKAERDKRRGQLGALGAVDWLASSQYRYRASASERRLYGGSTVTDFFVYRREDRDDPKKWYKVRGFGKTPGERKTFAIKRAQEMAAQGIPPPPL